LKLSAISALSAGQKKLQDQQDLARLRAGERNKNFRDFRSFCGTKKQILNIFEINF
jgi:hypothetical protein